MTTEERAELAAQEKAHMNCCQAVAVAYLDKTGLDRETVMRLASGFGSGMATTEGTCGALCGAVMTAGILMQGQGTPKISGAAFRRFKELAGSTVCREIKGIETGTVLCSCPDCCRNAVRALDEALAQ